MVILLLILVAAPVALTVLLRRGFDGRGFRWRIWVSLGFGAFMGFMIIHMLEPYLITALAFRMFPTWLWKLGMAVGCAISCAAPMRKMLEDAVPPREEDTTDDVGHRRWSQEPGPAGRNGPRPGDPDARRLADPTAREAPKTRQVPPHAGCQEMPPAP